ncbi:hypothetical protein [Nannocystis punicea]|uniref:Uncharacterized protein n=1 Tax=Nannocystis punicea TaxID=2995304 RepID=A0ABY7H6S9_9BACT|nr:hypothetical protein [Nannocystis poenicansa]WAS94927.1 hypothetical protein O0S08_02095 [Nannocystis poenicansa]
MSNFDAFARGALGITGDLHPHIDMTAIGLPRPISCQGSIGPPSHRAAKPGL